MSEQPEFAPGWPGIAPRWTSSAKQGVGASLSPGNRVWFTLSHGIFNEIYYPRVDQACTRDFGLLVTAGGTFFSEEKRHTTHSVKALAPGVPGFRLENTCRQGRYRLEKEILTDPLRETVLQQTRFVPLKGSLEEYHLYALLAPHIGNRGAGNTGWVGEYKGVPMLFAQREDICLAIASSAPWIKRSVGFVGFSDAWQDLSLHRRMTWSYGRAEKGNVALAGEVDLRASKGEFVIAVGFGRNEAEAGNRALASLSDGFEHAKRRYIAEWQEWQKGLLEPGGNGSRDLYRASTAVMRVHEAKSFPGGLIASLSIPWGFAKGDDDLGGYHLVWPRDLAEAAGGLLAAGANDYADTVLDYLQSTQEADGHWPQNMWLDGTPYWSGIQMDETAFPILLANLGLREKALDPEARSRLWPMVRRASAFIVQNGPVTPQDRWEEDPGYSPFTLAVQIAALVCAADLAEANGEPAVAAYLRETADAWNDNIERWTYVTGTDLAREKGVKGYYVRIAPPEVSEASSPSGGFVPIKNRPPGQSFEAAARIVSPDALALVRFGLRQPADPRILDTVRLIDSLLKVDTPFGPAWHRYNEDGYGEHADGSAFDGTGIGRAWPLITGERAHYELAAGRRDEAARLCSAIEAFAGEGGLLPEQIWDAADIPRRELFFGRPSGSAMPLLWAHAEYIKLRRSLRDGRVFDTPPQVAKRYLVENRSSPHCIWRFNQKCRTMLSGKILRVELLAPALVHWSVGDWNRPQDLPTRSTGLGVHLADLPTADLAPGTKILFTLRWQKSGDWEGTDYCVVIS
jgi:glucoamylase